MIGFGMMAQWSLNERMGQTNRLLAKIAGEEYRPVGYDLDEPDASWLEDVLDLAEQDSEILTETERPPET